MTSSVQGECLCLPERRSERSRNVCMCNACHLANSFIKKSNERLRESNEWNSSSNELRVVEREARSGRALTAAALIPTPENGQHLNQDSAALHHPEQCLAQPFAEQMINEWSDPPVQGHSQPLVFWVDPPLISSRTDDTLPRKSGFWVLALVLIFLHWSN